MTCVFILLGLLVLGFFAGPWVLLGLQYRRQREQTARVTDLQNELARLRGRVDQVLAAAAGAAPATSPAMPGPTPATSAPAFAKAAAPVEVAPEPPADVTAAAPAMDAAIAAGAAMDLPRSRVTAPP